MPTLYIVATPIGNLEDITLRAIRVLGEVDAIACEDTRVTKKLLERYNIVKPLLTYNEHRSGENVLTRLSRGENIALVTDAGTPGIQDPGNRLVAEVITRLPRVEIYPIPGPSALTALASVAGIPMHDFLFLGFPPVKKKRNTFFEKVLEQDSPVIIYESPYRILKTLAALRDMAQKKDIELFAVVGRELTKKFETIYRGNIDTVHEAVSALTKGEFVLILYHGKEKHQ